MGLGVDSRLKHAGMTGCRAVIFNEYQVEGYIKQQNRTPCNGIQASAATQFSVLTD